MIKFQQSQALTSHFESFWNIVNGWVWLCLSISRKKLNFSYPVLVEQFLNHHQVKSCTMTNPGTCQHHSNFSNQHFPWKVQNHVELYFLWCVEHWNQIFLEFCYNLYRIGIRGEIFGLSQRVGVIFNPCDSNSHCGNWRIFYYFHFTWNQF